MTLTVDDIIAKFPTKRLPIIDGEPDYASISKMVQLLYSNVATLARHSGADATAISAYLCPLHFTQPYPTYPIMVLLIQDQFQSMIYLQTLPQEKLTESTIKRPKNYTNTTTT
jgi:hypothetical protein